jgi:alpha-mannosidase
MGFNKKDSLSRREMLKIGAGLLAGTVMPDTPFTHMLPVVARSAAQAGVMHLYIAHDDHTDYFWEGTADTYVNVLHEILVENLNRIDATISEPLAHQHKFNCDGTLWVWNYEKEHTDHPEYLTRLINRIRDGHVSIPLNALCLCLGGTPAEGVLRGMYYAGSLERRFDLDIDLVYIVENQTLPYGIGALWAGSGGKYSWRGICGCQSKIDFNAQLTRQHEIYWWTGPDGSRILMKWYSFYGLQNLGGYSEAYHTGGTGTSDNTIPRLEQKITGLRQDGTDPYPFNIAGAFGYGWDYLHRPPVDFVGIAKANTNATRKVYVSNELDFFEHFESEYGNDVAPAETVIPTEALAFGNEWEQFQASMVEVTASVLRSIEKLRPAEAMATLVSLKNPTFMDSRTEDRDLAWMNLGLYWEHNWTANGDIAKSVRADWQRETATQINSYVNTLHNDAAAALGGLIQNPGGNTRFFAFNPLSWARTDYVDYPYPNGSTSVHAFDLAANEAVPSQIVTIDGVRYLRAWVENIPAVGYKVLEIRNGAAPGIPAVTLTANAGTGIIENDFYRITLNTRGAITSIIDKTRANREFAKAYGTRLTNDLIINNAPGATSGSFTVTNAGQVSITLTATSTSLHDHASSITLFRDSNRIDIRNRITENFSETMYWHFGFNLTNPDVMHEEVGAIIRAKYEVNGGRYSSLSKNGRYDGLTLAHFADMTGSEGVGVTLSTLDLQYMKLGGSTSKILDTTNAAISVLAGGQIDGPTLGIVAQDGDTQFLQRFGLQTHDAYNQVNAMKFGLEYQNPLAAGTVTGGSAYPATQFSLITASNPNVLLWSLKPAEDGMSAGIITRWWNVASNNQSLSFTMPNSPITSGRRVSHIETDIGGVTVSGGALTASLTAQQMTTYLLKNSAGGGALPGVPVLVAPADGAQTPGGQPILSWNAAANATRYELQLKSGSAPSSGDPVIPVTGLSYTPPTPLLVGQTYFWRVRSANSSNALSEWSATRDFTVASTDNAAPNRNYYRVKRPTLRWLPVTWALGYEIQIATNNTFTSNLITSNSIAANADSYTPTTDLTNGLWYWRVRAKKTANPDTWSLWSATEEFVIESP